jgi:hypothetical protein
LAVPNRTKIPVHTQCASFLRGGRGRKKSYYTAKRSYHQSTKTVEKVVERVEKASEEGQLLPVG